MRRAAWVLLALVLASPPAEPAQKERTFQKRFAASPGKLVVVDAADVDVELRSADIPDIEVTAELRISGVSEVRAADWVASHEPRCEDSAGRLVITVTPGEQGFMGLGHLTARARLRVLVPSSVVPDITTSSGAVWARGDFPRAAPLRLRTATGDIEVTGAAGGLDLRSSSGDSHVEALRPFDNFFARTASGDVSLTGGSRSVEVDTASGDVRLTDLSGPADVVTSSGKVVLRWDRIESSHKVEVRSASGRIHLVLPNGVTARGTLTTTGGTIRSDLPGTVNERSDTVELQGDGPTIDAETASGDILVGFEEEWQPAPAPTPAAAPPSAS